MENKPTETNPLSELTERFISQTDSNIFLTGKAGTGKTTLLHKIVESTHKRTVIVAPTGIAALNAGGVTIHSFFQLPFGAFVPDFKLEQDLNSYVKFETKSSLMRHYKMNASRRAVIRNLELLIIDEVSMLRADLLDAIDWTLRNIRGINKPFGGIQVLFIGDLFQLPPVIKPEEWSVLRNYYHGIYFFNALALREQPPINIELDKIYRQEDQAFVNILNHLRDNQLTEEDIDELNKRVDPDFVPEQDDEYITLTTHNRDADEINRRELGKLKEKVMSYDAEITGEFPESMYPLDTTLELKLGAQVMFIKNDSSFEKAYYNGKMGKIASLDHDEIKVLFPEEKKTVTVDRFEWNNIRYDLNPVSGEVEETVLGTFVQFPIKLAWAITVHKSQGLTFNKAIIDVSRVFVPGQAYVALSRMRSLEGMVLLNPISKNGLMSDQQVVTFTDNREEKESLDDKLETATGQYLLHVLSASFDWVDLYNKWASHEASYKKLGSKSLKGQNRSWVKQQVQVLEMSLDPARKFRSQLSRLLNTTTPDLVFVSERVNAAYDYFFKSLDGVVYTTLKKMAEIQRKKGSKQYYEELEELDQLNTEVVLKLKKARLLIEAVRDGREPNKEVIWTSELKNYKVAKVTLVRNEAMQNKTTFDFDTEFVPLKTITSKKKKKEKMKSTYDQTLELLEDGMSIKDIAEKRQLTESTVYSHCSRLLRNEKVELSDVLPAKKIEVLDELFANIEGLSLKEMKEKAGRKCTWDELRVYQASKII